MKSDLSVGSSPLNETGSESDSSSSSPLNTAPTQTDSLKYEGTNEVDARPIVTGGVVRTGTSENRLQLSQITPFAPNPTIEGGVERPALYIVKDKIIRLMIDIEGVAFFSDAGDPVGQMIPTTTPNAGVIIFAGTPPAFNGYVFTETSFSPNPFVSDLGTPTNPWGTIYATGFVVAFQGSTQTSQIVTAGFTLVPASGYVVLSAGSAVTSSATTAIANGAVAGQQLILQGTSNTNTVTIKNSANTALSADCVLGTHDTLSMVWDGSDWVETARSNN